MLSARITGDAFRGFIQADPELARSLAKGIHQFNGRLSMEGEDDAGRAELRVVASGC